MSEDIKDDFDATDGRIESASLKIHLLEYEMGQLKKLIKIDESRLDILRQIWLEKEGCICVLHGIKCEHKDEDLKWRQSPDYDIRMTGCSLCGKPDCWEAECLKMK